MEAGASGGHSHTEPGNEGKLRLKVDRDWEQAPLNYRFRHWSISHALDSPSSQSHPGGR
jgi:hypothetical protein